MPEIDKFKEVTAKQLVDGFNSTQKSAYIYTIMAQALQDSSPPFCLSLFGTNNRLTAVDVKNRMKYIKEQLSKVGVTAMGVASDGDPRLL